MTEGASRRLWVVTECYPRPRAETHCIFAHRQLTGVRDAGWQVSVLIPNGWFPRGLWRVARAWQHARAAAVPPGFAMDGIPVEDLRYRNVVPNRFNRPRDMSDLISLALDRHLQRVQATASRDVLLVQFALPFGPAVRITALHRRLPYVVHLRGDDVWVWPHSRREGMREFGEVVRGASLILAVSNAVVTEARRLAGDALAQSVVVANGIDLALFRPAIDEERAAGRTMLGLDASQPVVICVATAIERKGWRELLEALGALGPRSPALIAVTSGRGDVDLRSLRDALCPHVTMLHYHEVDALTLAALYRAADVFCLPSHGEGMSNAVLEALASGLPVITTRVGGHAEVVHPDVHGALIPPRDVAGITRALGHLLASAELRERMGRAGRTRAESIGTPRENGARVAALLDRLIAGESIAPHLRQSVYAAAGSD